MEAFSHRFNTSRDVRPPMSGEALRERRAQKLQTMLDKGLRTNRVLAQSLRTLANALEAADAGGVESSFLEHGPTIHALLRDLESITPLGVHRDERWSAANEDGSWRREPTVRATLNNEPSKLSCAPLPHNLGLTRKERQVLELLSYGHSNHGMALRLSLSESTVRTHLRSINNKLNASSRTQAIAISLKLGLVSR